MNTSFLTEYESSASFRSRTACCFLVFKGVRERKNTLLMKILLPKGSRAIPKSFHTCFVREFQILGYRHPILSKKTVFLDIVARFCQRKPFSFVSSTDLVQENRFLGHCRPISFKKTIFFCIVARFYPRKSFSWISTAEKTCAEYPVI